MQISTTASSSWRDNVKKTITVSDLLSFMTLV